MLVLVRGNALDGFDSEDGGCVADLTEVDG